MSGLVARTGLRKVRTTRLAATACGQAQTRHHVIQLVPIPQGSLLHLPQHLLMRNAQRISANSAHAQVRAFRSFGYAPRVSMVTHKSRHANSIVTGGAAGSTRQAGMAGRGQACDDGPTPNICPTLEQMPPRNSIPHHPRPMHNDERLIPGAALVIISLDLGGSRPSVFRGNSG